MIKLYGTWKIVAVEKGADWRQSVLISRSIAHNGLHELTVGKKLVNVKGNPFVLRAQAFNTDLGRWTDSSMRETARFEDARGIVLKVMCDDSHSAGDNDFDDLVFECTSSNTGLGKAEDSNPKLDLTIPENRLVFRKPRRRFSELADKVLKDKRDVGLRPK